MWVSAIFVITVLPTLGGLYWFAHRWALRRAIDALVAREQPGKGQLGRHTLVLADNGVVETTAVGETRTSWAGVDRIEQDDKYIYVYTSAAAAHIIPKRVFIAADADAFYQLAVHRQAAARTLSSQAPP
jgi:hypothetical protein